MRGIVALAKRYAAAHIEHACEIALKGNIRSCKAVRECVERLSERAQPTSRAQQGEGNLSPSLTQKDDLIRSGADYAIFFEQHASQGELFEKKTLH
jgi:hypothetical protein